MKTSNLFIYLLIICCTGCNTNRVSSTDIVQKDRDKIVDVSAKIKNIKTDVKFGSSHLYIADNVLIVAEISPKNDKSIHLFNKDTFEYLNSTGIIGRGPGEITNLGKIGIDEKNKILWVVDHGKKVMHKFPLDSILANNNFKPTSYLDMDNELLLVDFGFLNDSIILGRAIHPLSHSAFDMTMTKLNINTNEIERFGYENPECSGTKKIASFSLSVENNFFLNCSSASIQTA